jgi:DNA repair protein RecN (Recombination protein N)
LREAASLALSALDTEGAVGSGTGTGTGSGVLDGIGSAVAQLEGREPLEDLRKRALGLQAEVADLASDLRRVIETWEDDPTRLAAVSARRAKLADLRRKYGDTLEEVIAYAEDARARLAEVETTEERASSLAAHAADARGALSVAEAAVGDARRSGAPELASAVESHLKTLAMPAARIEIAVGADPSGDEITFLLGANPGESALPLAKVASGGELARTMLALRLVVSGGRPTLVFDEVDAGIGGAAANTVGRALAALAEHSQVLVVTHLPQVAAFAEQQIVVEKQVRRGRTVATVRRVDGAERVAELARMLSGRPGSSSARQHAEELLHESAGIRVAHGTVD